MSDSDFLFKGGLLVCRDREIFLTLYRGRLGWLRGELGADDARVGQLARACRVLGIVAVYHIGPVAQGETLIYGPDVAALGNYVRAQSSLTQPRVLYLPGLPEVCVVQTDATAQDFVRVLRRLRA